MFIIHHNTNVYKFSITKCMKYIPSFSREHFVYSKPRRIKYSKWNL